MAIDDLLIRLIQAVENSGSCVAVAEIIRQRDVAQKALERMTDNRDLYQKWYREQNAAVKKLELRIQAYRGAATRRKKAAKKGGHS